MAGQGDITQLLARHYGDPDLHRNPRLDTSRASDLPALPNAPPFRQEEVRSATRPGPPLLQAEKQVAQAIFDAIMTPYYGGRSAAELGVHAKEGQWGPAAVNALELGALLLPIPAARRGMPRAPSRTLEEYVDTLKQRRESDSPKSNQPLLNYDKYLENPKQTVHGRSREFETQEPAFKREEPQNVKNLDHYRTLDELREKRDAGLMSGPEGHPVNPWYWPSPLLHEFEKRLGPEEAHRRMSQFLNYNATTSMQTSVPRNIIEAWHVLHSDLNDLPFNRFTAGELTGAAHPNKVTLSADVAEGRGITSPTAPKIRNYSLNLHGVGTAAPEYTFGPTGEARRIDQPVTLDSMMAEAMKYRNKEGEPRERFVGAPYRSGMNTINKLADEVGAAGADTQAAIWQSHQFGKHGDPVYNDSYARIFDDVIQRVARERDQHPQEVLDDLILGRQGPPNNFTVKSLAPLAPPAGIALDYYYGDAPEG